MMQSSRLRKDKKIEGNIIKSVRSLFRLKKINRRQYDYICKEYF